MEFKELLAYGLKFMQMKLFRIGDTPIGFGDILIFLFLLIAFHLLARFTATTLARRVLARLPIEEGTRYVFRRITEYTIMIIGVIVAFQTIGINLTGLTVIFGLLSVGIGFGLQNIASNFISGLILLFEQPIRVGDRITVGDIEGDVEEINIRSTTIRSLNNISIIVPNSEFISSRVVNWSHGDRKVRIDLHVGVSYESDLDLVLKCLKEVALENREVLKKPAPDVLFAEFGDSSWDLELRVWIAEPKRHYHVRSDLNCAIVRKFRENGIEIPFPQRDVHIRSTETISPPSKN